MDITIVFVLLIGFLATLVRSTFGFGESLLAVPLFLLFLPVDTAVPLSVLLSVLVALVVVVQDHRQIHFSSAKWLILCAVPGIPLGLLILLYGNEQWVKTGLGLLIVAYALYALSGQQKRQLEKDHPLWLLGCGFISGVLGGAYGLNGPPLVIYGRLRQWQPSHFRATLQAYFLPASCLGLAGYAIKGLLTPTVWTYFCWSLPAVIPAIFLGRYFNRKLKSQVFFTYVYLLLVLIGLFLVVHTLYLSDRH